MDINYAYKFFFCASKVFVIHTSLGVLITIFVCSILCDKSVFLTLTNLVSVFCLSLLILLFVHANN